MGGTLVFVDEISQLGMRIEKEEGRGDYSSDPQASLYAALSLR